MAALAAAYFLAAELGLSLATVHENVSLVWPPTGLSLAVLLRLGPRFWPGVALGAFAANALTSAGPAAAAGIALGNTLEALVGVYLLRRFGFRATFERPYDAVTFVLLGAMLSPVVSATIGVASLCFTERALWTAYGFLWSTWWLGDAMGGLVVAPALLAFTTRTPALAWDRGGEAVASLLLLLAVSYAVLGGGLPLDVPGFPLAYTVFPFVIWAALAFGLRGATVTTVVISGMAIWSTLRGAGPFTATTITQGLMLLQAFVAVVALTGLVLASALAHRQAMQESMSRLAVIVESSDDAIIGMTPEGIIVTWNRGAERIYGYPADEVLGRAISIVVPPERLDELSWIMERVRSGEHIRHHQTVRATKEGRRIQVSLSIWPIEDRAGRVVGISTIARDISEQKAAEAALEQANRELTRWVDELEGRTRQATLLSEMSDLLQSCRTSGEAYAVIRRFAERLFPGSVGLLGLLRESRNVVEVVAFWGEDVGYRAFSPESCWALRRGRSHAVRADESSLLCDHLAGRERIESVCVPMMAGLQPLGVLHLHEPPDRTGREYDGGLESRERAATAMAGQVALTLANLKLQETLRGQAVRDPLTGLFNRRYLEESLDREIHQAMRNGTPLGLIMVDIDHFKRFNDAHGHEAGDVLLAALGNWLRASVREEDFVCRYGGEEFTLILPEATLEISVQRAREICEGVRHLAIPGTGGVLRSVAVSAGVATYPQHGSNGRELLAAADAALYQAKREGRNRLAVAAVEPE